MMPGHLKNQIMWICLPENASFSKYGFFDLFPGPSSLHIEIYSIQISTSTLTTNVLVPILPNCLCFAPKRCIY